MTNLSPKHEQLIQSQLATGRYEDAEEVLDLALNLLAYLDEESKSWVDDTKQKIVAGIAELNRGEGVDGSIVMNQFLDKFQTAQWDE